MDAKVAPGENLVEATHIEATHIEAVQPPPPAGAHVVVAQPIDAHVVSGPPVIDRQSSRFETGIMTVHFLPSGSCSPVCWACCCCCWVCSQPQPSKKTVYEVVVDGNLMGRLRQGQSSSWVVPPGPRTVKINKSSAGLNSFISGLMGGGKEVCSEVILIQPGRNARYELGCQVQHCQCTGGWVMYLREARRR